MINAPATRFSQVRSPIRKVPTTDALAPSAMKTPRKPTKKSALAVATLRLSPCLRSLSCSKVTPLIVET